MGIYSVFTETDIGAYRQLLVIAIARAINTYREKHRIGEEYKISVIIDGLKTSEESKIGRQLRTRGIRYKKVRGARDESEPLIRLADRIAGLVRDADNKGRPYQTVRRIMERQKIINRL